MLIGLAQAAAILVAAWMIPGRQPQKANVSEVVVKTPDLSEGPQSSKAGIEIDAGQVVILREKAGAWDKVELASDDSSGQVDANYAMFNVVESMADEIE